MSRHIRWGWIFILGFLNVVVAASPRWLPSVQPLLGEREIVQVFECPSAFEQDVCTELEKIYERNPAEAEAMITELSAPRVPGPSDEVDEDSILAGIDQNAVAQIVQTRVRVGGFEEIDLLHSASGTVTIWEIVADGTVIRVLRFDSSFSVTNGPNLHVYLSAHPDPRTEEELKVGDIFLDVGGIKGTDGAQNYPISSDLDLTDYSSVVIFSPDYGTVFSTATLQQPIQ